MAVYKERTYLTPLIRWIGVAAVAAIMLGSLFAGLFLETGSYEGTLATMIGFIGGIIGILIMIILRLDLKVSADAVEYQMIPLEWKVNRIKSSEIESMEVKKISVFPRYGGFGRRRKPWKKEVAYILNRDHGLYVRLKDGRTRIFSTARAAKLKQFLRANYPETYKEQ